MKKLPKIYQNNFIKEINNNRKKCYVTIEKEPIIEETSDITLEEIFSGIGYSYNIPIIITTTKQKYITSLIAKTKHNLITIDNDLIPLSDVISIKRKKN